MIINGIAIPDDLINAEEEKKKLQKEYEIVYEEGVKTKSLLDQTINEYNQTKSLLEQGICPHCLQKIEDMLPYPNFRNFRNNSQKNMHSKLPLPNFI